MQERQEPVSENRAKAPGEIRGKWYGNKKQKHDRRRADMKENVEELVKEKLGQGAVFPAGEENTAFSQYFKGQSYLKMLTTAGVGIGNVTFEPGCRNNWHIHHKGGQILLVTGGRGWYQEWGKEAVELHAGDVVNIPPEVKHWHGAAKDSWFQHLAVEVPADGASNEWLEAVEDEEYSRLP
ncbi:UNVERIFIED_ORG: cupin [Lacrimispora saccharolytica]|nr:cupin domain-containing protein [Clostridium sp.]CBK77382.1 Uncharacterized conserved protein, contains double-stranded beta-helix domain [[Clostridium] cf. saccharolyticum K10]